MRKDVAVLFVLLGLTLLIVALAYRPAAFIGVQPGALARSVGAGVVELPGEPNPGECEQHEDDVWTCRVSEDASGLEEYAVKTRRFGCWDAWEGKKPGSPKDVSHSGCITGLDFAFGD